jgi:uncharacterized protein (DUF2236 family)
MYEVELDDIRRKFVLQLKLDPPPVAIPREPLAPVFDRWVAQRFTPEEVGVLFRVELEYGERVIGEWFAEVLHEAGVAPMPRPLAAA